LSFLTPLYILGAFAIAAPIIFHLIRRMPRGEVSFSSLMFLSPTPPRMTRRSRIENWLLLLLRSAAVLLLALAFARPFLRQAALLGIGDSESRRVAILIDTSASLRRGDLWNRAIEQATQAIGSSRPGDDLAVLSFDTQTRTLMSFEESESLDPARRQAVARSRLSGLSPSWGATQTGQALIDAVSLLQDVKDTTADNARAPRQVILVTDLQRGSHLEALGGFEWPPDVELLVKSVADDSPNASLQGLGDSATSTPDEKAEAGEIRVRVANELGASTEQFKLAWEGSTDQPTPVYVPPGESRVVRLKQPPKATTLRLEGDAHSFDNLLYLTQSATRESTVLYVGPDAPDDPAGLLYYLSLVCQDQSDQKVTIRAIEPDTPILGSPGESIPLVVVGGSPSAANIQQIRRLAEAGAVVLLVIRNPDQATAFSSLIGLAEIKIEEAKVAKDVMLGEIDFGHPLFAPLAAPQFNDFTKIHFWKYRHIDIGESAGIRALARFENQDPAILEKLLGKGTLILLTTSWVPADSQLARSSKFVALMAGLLKQGGLEADMLKPLRVGDSLALDPIASDAAPVTIREPSGSLVELSHGATVFSNTDEPGVYVLQSAAEPRSFAVNLDPSEGQTAPLDIESLEQLGCRLADSSPILIDPDHARQLRNAELEGRQKIWRWLIVAAIGILILETLLASRNPRPRQATAEAALS
jgi:Aerotolerance regulator N-terminal/von Willebrand factor type A domain